MKLAFHKATQEDIKDLQKVINNCVKFKLSKNDMAWGTEPWTDAEVSEAIGFGNTYMVSVDGQAIGCVDLIWSDVYNWAEPLGSDAQAGYLTASPYEETLEAKV